MLPEIQFRNAKSLTWKKLTGKNVRALPGSDLHRAETNEMQAECLQYQHPLFSIGYRVIRFFKSYRLSIREKSQTVRLQAVLKGELPAHAPDGSAIMLQPGQYQISVHPSITALFKKDSACRYFVTHYSRELIDHSGLKDIFKPTGARKLTAEMANQIQKILQNPFAGHVRTFHYENCIRELLRLHLTQHDTPVPGELSGEDIAKIYAADTLLVEELKIHYRLNALARKTGLSEGKLKKGFRQVFKMGVFERLTYHRMKYAKELLRSSYRTIDDIASVVGYHSRSSFTTAFKASFDVSPTTWRKENSIMK